MPKIIAYTYEADYHCHDCTIKRFIAMPHTSPDIRGVDIEATDSEGNPVHPVFDTDDTPDSTCCCDCHAVITNPFHENVLTVIEHKAKGDIHSDWMNPFSNSACNICSPILINPMVAYGDSIVDERYFEPPLKLIARDAAATIINDYCRGILPYQGIDYPALLADSTALESCSDGIHPEPGGYERSRKKIDILACKQIAGPALYDALKICAVVLQKYADDLSADGAAHREAIRVIAVADNDK